MSPTYVRSSGPHVAERVRPADGSEDAQRLAALADDPSSPWRVEDVPEPDGKPTGSGRPPQAAAKDAWVAYAVSCGASQADADAVTKAALIELYGKDGA
jgi:hypothetical protein